MNIETLSQALSMYREPKPERRSMERKQNRVIDGLERLLTVTPYECEVSEWKEAIQTLIETYFVLQLDRTYARISPEILKVGTKVTLPAYRFEGSTYQNVDLIFPTFACAKYGDPDWMWTGRAKATLQGYGGTRDVGLNVTLTAPTPPLTKEVKRKAAEARATLYEHYAAALRHPLLGDLITANKYTSLGIPLPSPQDVEDAELHVLWRPTPEQVKMVLKRPPEKDPALLLSFLQRLYLVTTWYVKDEQPFQHLLKEYTSVVGSMLS